MSEHFFSELVLVEGNEQIRTRTDLEHLQSQILSFLADDIGPIVLNHIVGHTLVADREVLTEQALESAVDKLELLLLVAEAFCYELLERNLILEDLVDLSLQQKLLRVSNKLFEPTLK